MRLYVAILCILIMSGCQDDVVIPELEDMPPKEVVPSYCPLEISTDCLGSMIAVPYGDDCETETIFAGCEPEYIGMRSLSVASKSQFADFCNILDTEIGFKDAAGNNLICKVDDHRFNSGGYSIAVGFNSPECTQYCLSNEQAIWGLRSERFALEICLKTGLRWNRDAIIPQDYIVTSFNIWAKLANSRQVIFILPIEDRRGSRIDPDTTNIRFHPEIVLNGKQYDCVYSNENWQLLGVKRKEKVYFDVERGLIAVRDSLGTLWTRE